MIKNDLKVALWKIEEAYLFQSQSCLNLNCLTVDYQKKCINNKKFDGLRKTSSVIQLDFQVYMFYMPSHVVGALLR